MVLVMLKLGFLECQAAKGLSNFNLKAYRSLERDAGDYSLVMQSASQNLKDKDIEALANYMHGLYQK